MQKCEGMIRFLKTYLSNGCTSLNTVVDLTNFVDLTMLEKKYIIILIEMSFQTINKIIF